MKKYFLSSFLFLCFATAYGMDVDTEPGAFGSSNLNIKSLIPFNSRLEYGDVLRILEEKTLQVGDDEASLSVLSIFLESELLKKLTYSGFTPLTNLECGEDSATLWLGYRSEQLANNRVVPIFTISKREVRLRQFGKGYEGRMAIFKSLENQGYCDEQFKEAVEKHFYMLKEDQDSMGNGSSDSESDSNA